jgi:prepilin-type N-terminal cleavage/methylation domain-containing protein
MFTLKKKSIAGFTLIEMSVVVLILGIMIAGLSPLYSLYLKNQAVEDTNVDIDTITNAIGSFRSIHGRYPCPASLTMNRDDDLYGHELCDGSPEANAIAAAAAGNCTDGVCIEQSIRNDAPPYDYLDFAGAARQSPANPIRVRVGFIPFRNLNLEEGQAYDGYHNRFVYVVTEHLAAANSFTSDGGGIEIRNDQNATLIRVGNTDLPGTAHFLVFSHGVNGEGAFTEAGVQVPCPAAGPESENCNIQTTSIYRDIQTASTGDANTQFDDVLGYFTRDEVPLWQLSEAVDHGADIHQKPGGQVGIHMEASHDMDDEGRGTVGGNIRATDDPDTVDDDGRIMMEEICNVDGTRCFPPSVLAGTVTETAPNVFVPEQGMPCPAGQFLREISDNKAVCTNIGTLRCPAGQYINGFNDDGTLDCIGAPPAGCATTTKNLCGTPKELLAGSHGTTRTIDNLPNTNRRETWRCDNGTWRRTAQSGSCNCNAGTNTTVNPCGQGYTGNETCTATTVCPAGTTSTTCDRSACVCDPFTRTRTQNCPAPQTGNIFQENNYTCVNNVPTPGTWTTISNTCACAGTEIRNKQCAGNLTGLIREEWRRAMVGGTCAWEFVREVSNTCACVPKTDRVSESCAPGLVGEIIKERQLVCPAATWTAFVEVSNTCAPPRCEWVPISDPQGPFNYGTGREEGDPCACGTAANSCHRRTAGQFTIYQVCQCRS